LFGGGFPNWAQFKCVPGPIGPGSPNPAPITFVQIGLDNGIDFSDNPGGPQGRTFALPGGDYRVDWAYKDNIPGNPWTGLIPVVPIVNGGVAPDFFIPVFPGFPFPPRSPPQDALPYYTFASALIHVPNLINTLQFTNFWQFSGTIGDCEVIITQIQ